MVEIDEDFLDKLRKIRELANPERGGKPEEIANAESMLQRMLSDRGLSMADIDAIHAAAGIVHEGLEDRLDEWKQALLYHLGVNNFCKVLVFPREGEVPEQAIIVGEAGNIAHVKEMYAWLVEEFPQVTQEALEERKNWSWDGGYKEDESFMSYLARSSQNYLYDASQELAWFSPEIWQGSYLYGLVLGFGEKLAQHRREATPIEKAFSDSESIGSSLAVIEGPKEKQEEEVNEYVDQHFETETVDVVGTETPAFHEGREKGRTFPLERQIKDGALSTLAIQE